MQGAPAGQQQPQPLLVPKKGLQPLPNPRQSLARAKLTAGRGRPPSGLFGMTHQAFVPPGEPAHAR